MTRRGGLLITGRVCCGLEIDPKYCASSSNGQHLSGRYATMEADGRTFEQIKAARLEVAAWNRVLSPQIADIEAQIPRSHPNVEGPCLALPD